MPSQPILNVNDATLWEEVYDITLIAQSSPVSNVFTPLPKFNIPHNFTKHTLAIGASNSYMKPNWNLAFYLAMNVRIEGIGKTEVTNRFVRIGLTLIRFPPVASAYTLQARIPKWHREMSFTIWQYIGEEKDVLDLLEVLSTSQP